MKKLLLPFLIAFTFYTTAQSLNSGLIVHYNFDQTAQDATTNNNHLVGINGNSFIPFFQSDSAYYLNGSAGLSQTNNFNNVGFTQTSVALWFKATNLNNNQQDQTLVQGAYAGFGVALNNTTGKLKVFFANSSFHALLSINNYIDSTWHHVVAQNDGSRTFLYVDGSLIGSLLQTYSNGSATSNQKKIYVGSSNQSTRYYQGGLNDLRIYDRVLTQPEITTLSTFPSLTSVSKISHEASKINIYPNPTKQNITISCDEYVHKSIFLVRNLLGQQITEGILQTEKQTVQIDGPKGIYFVEIITSDNKKLVRKVVKN